MDQGKREEFLKKTKYCDWDHDALRSILDEIGVDNRKEDIDKVWDIFNWVKENIEFKFDYWGKRASDVAKKRTGMCTNKANLFVSLSRASGIPAGFGKLKIRTADFYGVLMCPSFSKAVSEKTTHIYGGVFVNGRWVICDPSLDNGLLDAFYKKTPFTDFNGFDLSDHDLGKINGVIERVHFLADIDNILDKKINHATHDILELLNAYLYFSRTNGSAIKDMHSVTEIEYAFSKWILS